MSSYNDLVTKILNTPVLKKAMETMISCSDVLNLVSPNWEKNILNSTIYKTHNEKVVGYSKSKSQENKFQCYSMNKMEYHYHVLVTGCWKFNIIKKDNTNVETIVCNSSQPLSLIGKSMAEHDRQAFVDNSRFFIQSCDASLCSTCEKAKEYSIENNTWCIKNTKVFNGERIRYMLRKHMLNAFGYSRFYGILRLRIHSRTTYGDNKYKIGGLCSDMILFNESALDPPINIDYMFMSLQTSSHDNPKITFPEDVEKNNETSMK